MKISLTLLAAVACFERADATGIVSFSHARHLFRINTYTPCSF